MEIEMEMEIEMAKLRGEEIEERRRTTKGQGMRLRPG